ncbi:MAG: murein biosynthesis integral membrane protein MurJ [Bellilinea sp.]
MKLSRVTRITFLLTGFFALDKVVGFVRQVVIARQFGLSAELDAFNVANNLPDLLFALISGGALALAFIPVLTEQLSHDGKPAAWDLFSKITNLAFLVTGALAIVVAIIAHPLVRWELGIAPGFNEQQQVLVTNLMRLNLFATLIFSISGLVMAGLQANQHFLLPAIAPLLYNIGQIFGAVILSPEQGYTFGPITLPALGLGVYGLVYGVIIGALLHLGIQIPGLLKYKFRWSPGLGLKTEPVRKVLRLMGPRLVTMFFIQLIFLVRDNLASRLEAGAVTALTYGWMLFQVPETLIGTAIGTALLPTLAEHVALERREEFQQSIERAVRVLVALTLPIAVILSFGLKPLLALAFGFDAAGTDLLMWITRAYLAGLLGQSLVEVFARSFYARQNALTPLAAAGFTLVLYIVLGTQLYRVLGVAGISLSDSIAFTAEAVLLLVLLNRKLIGSVKAGGSLLRAFLAAAASGAVVWLLMTVLGGQNPLLQSGVALTAGTLVAIPLVWPELRLILRL